MKSTFDHPQQSPGFLLWKLTTAWQRQIRQVLKNFGLTHVQFVFLACLQWLCEKEHVAITQSQLAEISQLDKMVISESTQKLLKKRLIIRSNHKEDDRAYTLKLTTAGKKLIDRVLPLIEAADKKFFQQHQKQLLALNQIVNKK